jgi:plasmid stabilization system protein ParE
MRFPARRQVIGEPGYRVANSHRPVRAFKTYIEQFNPRAAEELAVRLLAAGNSLQNFPHRGRPVPGTSMRELLSVPSHTSGP